MNLIKSAIALSALVLLGGCAAAESPAPTHHWASAEAVSAIKYRQDHARCQVEANTDLASTTYEADSDAFQAYRQCMTNSGYVLTASNE